MSVERIIGVDFGTSTSAVRVKRYENGKPIDERLSCKPVEFNMGNTMVPTLVRKCGDDSFYGYAAEIKRRDSVLYQSFKVFLEDADSEKKSEARKLTLEYLKYLAGVYREQSNGGHLGDASDKERTIISYPVKWSEETKKFMIEAAREAGFPNVSGMDEANAAIRAVTIQNEDALRNKGFLRAGTALNILLLDMGAGTTDLVLCKYTPRETSETKILCTYPKDGNILFGGREVDNLLGEYITEKIPSEHRAKIKIDTETYKVWKEFVISPTLSKSETVEQFADLDQLAMYLGFDVEFTLNRQTFERLTSDYLNGLPELIKGCLKESGIDGSDIDLVVLTGGHSQWYFVKEILCGNNKTYGDCGLKKIEADNDRIISISLPQETVALGLAFSGMNVNVVDDSVEDDEDVFPKNEEKSQPFIERTDFLCPVEDVFYISNRGTVATGRIERGAVNIGDTVEIVGLSNYTKTIVVEGIELFSKTISSAKEGESVGLLLKGIARNEVRRGQVICKPGSVKASKRFKAAVRFNTKEEGGLDTPFFDNDKFLFWFRTLDIAGSINLPEGKEMIIPGEETEVNVELVTPIAIEKDLLFAIRKDEKSIGVGYVIENDHKSKETTHILNGNTIDRNVRVFNIENGKSIKTIASEVSNFLQEQNMETYYSTSDDGEALIQGRVNGWQVKRFLGRDKAIQIVLVQRDKVLFVRIGIEKWLDKIVKGSMMKLFFAGVEAMAIVDQKKLISDVYSFIEKILKV